jgi:hypothetical protein
MVVLLKANTGCEQRSNYAEPSILAGVGDEDEEVSNKYSKGRGRQTISDKRQLNLAGNSPASRKKKSTMNVRTALLYRKNLATLIDESVCSLINAWTSNRLKRPSSTSRPFLQTCLPI